MQKQIFSGRGTYDIIVIVKGSFCIIIVEDSCRQLHDRHFKAIVLTLLEEGGGLTLYEIYIGFCPRIEFHNIMYNDSQTRDCFICDIFSLLPIYNLKNTQDFV